MIRGACRYFHLVLMAFLIGAVTSSAVAQDDDEPTFVGIRLGLDNRYVVGSWTQLDLLVRGGDVPMTVVTRVRTEDGDGVMSAVFSPRPASLIPGQVTPIRLYVKPGRTDAEFEATLIRVDDDSGDEVAERRFETNVFPDELHPAQALQSNQNVYLSIGQSVGLEGAAKGTSDYFGRETVVARLDSVANLPTRWYGYDGITAVLLPTSQPEVLRALTATSAQLASLDEWVRLGGTLLISVGSSASEILAADSPLARFAPGKFVGLAPLRQLRELETYAGATQPLSVPTTTPKDGQPAEARLDVPQLSEVQGRVEVREGDDLPLVIRTPYGFGEVIFVALDLDRAPFARWNDRGKLIQKLLRLPTPIEQPANTDPNAFVPQPNYTDISAQLSRSLDEFVGVKIAPFALVALLIAGYIILIGPVDYLLVRRVFKRMELTWITFPLMVVAVSAGAYLLAAWMKGDKLLVNQARIVDVDLATQSVRGTEWINVFSPAVERYDVTIAPTLPDGKPAADARRLVSWMGKAEMGYGMGRPSGRSMLGRGYVYTPDLDTMEGVPIQFWSTKPFVARWDAAAPQSADWIDIELRRTDSTAIEGKLVNRLPVVLESAMLIYKDNAYPLGRISTAGQPGAEVTIDAGSRRGLRDEFQITQQYNQWTTEMTQILPRMMLFEALGQSPDRQLVNRHQEFVDLSPQLDMGRAILLFTVADAPLDLQLDDKPAPGDDSRRWTYYRFLIPVDETSEEAQP